ncbi:hypothetical protein RRG08_031428 [Elysia crispata]|uniref:Uncharacterized protein n=1 Tax=Elysia crispata TaxID=231223 RepID=A0AAE0ZND6_9GAST|nr:hypothetical protein RRG08_031428 [Elysia crispata]
MAATSTKSSDATIWPTPSEDGGEATKFTPVDEGLFITVAFTVVKTCVVGRYGEEKRKLFPFEGAVSMFLNKNRFPYFQLL